VLLILWPGAASAGERWESFTAPVFRHYGLDNGLTNQVVTALAEDRDGFIWVGTEGGLVRWDGYRFRSYLADSADDGSLGDNFIRCLFRDAAGELWIGTNSGGLYRYDRKSDRFIRYGEALGDHAGIRALAEDGQGRLWIGTENGLFSLNRATGKAQMLPHLGGSSADDNVWALLRDHSGTLWIGTAAGLVRAPAGGNRFETVPFAGPGANSPRVRSLFEDSAGRLWIGTFGRGAYMLRPDEAHATAIHETDEAQTLLDTAKIYDMLDVGPHEVWLATLGAGVIAVDTQTWRTRRIHRDINRPSSLLHDMVWALLRDRSGAIWIGTAGGLSRFDPTQTGITMLFGSAKDEAPPLDDVLSTLGTSDGNLWLGLTDGTVAILSPQGNHAARLRIRAEPASSGQAAVYSITQDEDRIFLATDQGLFETTLSGRPIRQLQVPGRDPTAWAMTMLRRGRELWIGGVADGLWRFDLETGKTLAHYDGRQLTDSRVSVIVSDPSGKLWVGTRDGLNLLDPATGTITHIVADRKQSDGLSSAYMLSLAFDRHGRLWIGTLGDSLDILDPLKSGEPPHFRHIGVKDGLPNASVCALMTDESGRMWSSTGDGIVVIDPDSFTIQSLQQAEGVSVRSFWSLSGTRTQAGEFIFGGVGGAVVIRPDRIVTQPHSANMVVTDLRVGDTPVPVARVNESPTEAPLVILPESNRLAAEVSLLDYAAPERTRYAFWMENFDSGWSEIDSTQRTIRYTNLPPGSYRLHLRGTAGDEVGELSFPLEVRPRWRQTLWFRLGLVVIAGTGCWLLIRLRTASLHRQRQALEVKVAARTRELAEAAETLRQANAELDRLANVDGLTGLANRRHFVEVAENTFAQASRYGHALSVFLVDLDHFKQVNDTYGHGGGDAVLKAAASCLAETLRDSDLAARFGGEELIVLLPNTDEAGAARLADRFLLALSALEIPHEEVTIQVTASAGVASRHSEGDSLEAIIERADKALYRAKRGGRNRVETQAADSTTY
jgi:diguanylate cyclase (GGDEF)-like protein